MSELRSIPAAPDLLDRMVRAVERVRERLRRATAALEDAGIPYAVVGGNAVASWVARVDEAAVRDTQDVDVLLNRSDLEAAKQALARAGFVFRHVKGIDMFLDGPDAKARDAVHILFAGEKVRQSDPAAAPRVEDSEATGTFRVVALESLVRMKLTSFRDKDRTHLRDMIGVELIDDSWLPRLPDPLAERLKELLESPEG
jgi:hypothetical protein